ncbi:MAG TPA: hypothetical protein VFK43_23090, partial [Acidimicrobiales bacterium]|nr:hypothetical protein [Acidimicrobiales bacterium]
PVRRQVVPVSLPANVSDELKGAIARHGTRLPEIAQIFGVEPDPRAGRPEARRKRKPGTKPKAGRPTEETKPTPEQPETQQPAEPGGTPPPVAEDVQQAPTEAPAPEMPAAEAPEAEPQPEG